MAVSGKGSFEFLPFTPEIFDDLKEEDQKKIAPFYKNQRLQCELVVHSGSNPDIGVLIYERTEIYAGQQSYVLVKGLAHLDGNKPVLLFREMVKRVEMIAQAVQREAIHIVFTPEEERGFKFYLKHLPLKRCEEEGQIVYLREVAPRRFDFGGRKTERAEARDLAYLLSGCSNE